MGRSAALQTVLGQLEHVAKTDATVLLLGETGTGKEVLATRLHTLSARCGRPMVRVNCAALPSTLIESELFGREKGAFTDAVARQIGRFETADHSTIFLDEIGDLPTDVQVKLLRVLEERQIERLGSPRSIRINVRIVAATHRNLEQRIAEGTFREDLFYRLNVFPIQVPALRERPDDIPQLVWHFVEECSGGLGKRIETIADESMRELQHYGWPGNIRELRNVVERAMILATGPHLSIPVPRAATSCAIPEREARGRSEGAHPERARGGRLADPGRGRRGRATGSPADDARDAHGQARRGQAETSVIGAAPAPSMDTWRRRFPLVPSRPMPRAPKRSSPGNRSDR